MLVLQMLLRQGHVKSRKEAFWSYLTITLKLNELNAATLIPALERCLMAPIPSGVLGCPPRHGPLCIGGMKILIYDSALTLSLHPIWSDFVINQSYLLRYQILYHCVWMPLRDKKERCSSGVECYHSTYSPKLIKFFYFCLDQK